MVYHIVMWNFKEGVTEEKKAEIKATLGEKFKGLIGVVPGLISVEFVPVPLSSSTHEIALMAKLEKPEDIPVYANHPAHLAIADTYVRPNVCDRACLDFESTQET